MFCLLLKISLHVSVCVLRLHFGLSVCDSRIDHFARVRRGEPKLRIDLSRSASTSFKVMLRGLHLSLKNGSSHPYDCRQWLRSSQNHTLPVCYLNQSDWCLPVVVVGSPERCAQWDIILGSEGLAKQVRRR